MAYAFHTVDVFTERPFGGNPLAVFPDARGLDGERMQAIARELNLSETTFVLPAVTDRGTCRVRIFTPAAELPFAGHPTLGTAFVLAMTGAVPAAAEESEVVLEEGVGPVPVTIRWSDGKPTFCRLTAAHGPEAGPEPPAAGDLARMLGLPEEAVGGGTLLPASYSCGVPFVFVPVRDGEDLGRAALDLSVWREVLADSWAPEVFVLAPGGTGDGVDYQGRMFAPRLGVPEDPATGSAAAALAGYLGDRAGVDAGTLAWKVEQGVHMGRPSLLHVEADLRDGEVIASRVGGASVRISEGTFLAVGH